MANKSGLGYSPLTERVYWGRQNPEKRIWIGDKKDVTLDFISVAHEYFQENSARTISNPSTGSHLFIHVKNDAEGIKKAISYLQKLYKSAKENP